MYNGGVDRRKHPRVDSHNFLEVSMSSNQEKTTSAPMLLTQDIVRFGGMQLYYKLCVRESRPHNRFEISISLNDECVTAEAGEALDFALYSYRRIVSSIVTPCTLEDVMKDFEYSRTNLQKKLYKRAFM